MKSFVHLLFFLTCFYTISFAREMSPDSAFLSNSREVEYHIQPDTTTNLCAPAERLLLGDDYFKRAGFLNQFQLREKSYSQARWQLDSVVVNGWNEANSSVQKSLKQLFLPENDGRKMILKNYNWNAEEDHWQINEAFYYFFNEQGRLDSLEYQFYVTLNYLMLTKTHYTYENGLLKSEWSEEKFDEFDDWEKTQRMVYEYDSVSQLTQVYTQEVDPFSDQWQTFAYIEYEYDSLGNRTHETGYDYESYDMISTKTYELEYSYNTQNQLSRVVEYIEGWQPGTFVPERMQQNAYNASAELETETWFNWDYDQDGWLESKRKIYFHETAGNELLGVKTQEWNSQWTDKARSDYFADAGVLRDEIKHHEFLFSFLPLVEIDGLVCDRIRNTAFVNDSWQGRGSTLYHLSKTSPVGIQTAAKLNVKCYPNPVSGWLFIETTTGNTFDCNVFDMLGRSLLHKKVAGKSQLNVSGLLPGYYILKISDNDQTLYSGKLIKR